MQWDPKPVLLCHLTEVYALCWFALKPEYSFGEFELIFLNLLKSTTFSLLTSEKTSITLKGRLRVSN